MSAINLWAIFYNTADYPGEYSARRFYGEQPTEDCINNQSINVVREWVLENAKNNGNITPYIMERHPKDAVVVFETWIEKREC